MIIEGGVHAFISINWFVKIDEFIAVSFLQFIFLIQNITG